MKKKIISGILAISLLNLAACRSFQRISNKEAVSPISSNQVINIRVNETTIYNDLENMGFKISIEKSNGEFIEGELLSVRQNSLLIIPMYQPEIILENHLGLVQKIEIINEPSTLQTCTTLGGAIIVGALIGAKIGAEAKDSKTFEEDFKAGILGALIGALVGIGVGLGINSLLTNDEVIEINSDFDYKQLMPYARFKVIEPDYLKMIE